MLGSTTLVPLSTMSLPRSNGKQAALETVQNFTSLQRNLPAVAFITASHVTRQHDEYTSYEICPQCNYHFTITRLISILFPTTFVRNIFCSDVVLFNFCTCCTLGCLVCIVVILCVLLVLCVHCCFYFRCRTAG